MKCKKISRLFTIMTLIVLISFNTLFVAASPSHTTDLLLTNGALKIKDLVSTNQYSVNKNGETYGHDIYTSPASQSPALMEAYGINGTLGYVRASDYGSNPSTPEEAIEQEKNSEGKIIYLYDKDGKTVIGIFDILN